MTTSEPAQPDAAALAAQAARVRARLDADPDGYRLPATEIEAWAFVDFLSPADCQRLIGLIDQTAAPSSTFDPENKHRYRTSYSGDMDRFDSFVAMIERRIDDLTGIDYRFGETIQGQRYTQGQEYQAHCDYFAPGADYFLAEQKTGGQRSFTAMIYLNEVEAGGTTDFPRAGVTFTPRQGMALVWNNMRPDGSPNPYTLHAATPVERGVKYVITKWYRTREWGRQG